MRCAPCSPSVSDLCAWNDTARKLVAETKTTPPMAARAYALLSLAHLAAVERSPRELDAISDRVLSFLFPAAFESTQAASELSCEASAIVTSVIEHARTDGSDRVWNGTVPVGPGSWVGTMPLLPLWGEVKPRCLASGEQFRADPPPAFGSPCFERALAEVRRISDRRTEAQLEIARFWADGPGTATPPGHWNQIACEILERTTPDVRRAARVLATLNVALMDASICCWDTKYFYWLLRPSQADPAITTPVGLPNFPSYTSGHATFSGAAARVLGALIPSVSFEVEAMAEEAALSRLYGGIHFRFDNEAGLEGGRKVADVALDCEIADLFDQDCDCRR